MSVYQRISENKAQFQQTAKDIGYGTNQGAFVAPQSWVDYASSLYEDAYGGKNIVGQDNIVNKAIGLGQGAYDIGKSIVTGVGKSAVAVGDIYNKMVYEPSKALGQTIAGSDPWVMAGDKSFASRYQENLIKNISEQTMYEKVFDKKLINPDGNINWKDAREFIGAAAEAPTYFYGGSIGLKSLMNPTSKLSAKVVGNAILGAQTGGLAGLTETLKGDDYNNLYSYLNNVVSGTIGGALIGAATTYVGSKAITAIRDPHATAWMISKGIKQDAVSQLTKEQRAMIYALGQKKDVSKTQLNKLIKGIINENLGAKVNLIEKNGKVFTQDGIAKDFQSAREKIAAAIKEYRKNALPIYQQETKAGRQAQIYGSEKLYQQHLKANPGDYAGAVKARLTGAKTGTFERSGTGLKQIVLGENDTNTLLQHAMEGSTLKTAEKINFSSNFQRFLDGEALTNSEIKILSKGLGIDIHDIIKSDTLSGKAMDLVRNTFGLVRGTMATGDISVIGRQNFAAFSDMLLSLDGGQKALIDINKRGLSYLNPKTGEQALAKRTEEHMRNPLFQYFIDHGLEFTDVTSKFSASKEDIYRNADWVQKIPILRDIANPSERHFTGVSNDTRMYMAEREYNKLIKAGYDPMKDGKAFSFAMEAVNAATGKGSLPKVLKRYEKPIKDLAWSAGLISSRLHYLNPRNYLDPNIPKSVKLSNVKQAASMLAVASSFIALAKAAGAEIEEDPRSTNFLKAKSGNNWVDFTGGFQPYLKFAAQEFSGQVKSSTGKITNMDTTYGGPTRFGTAMSFARSKLAPMPAFTIDMLTGTNAVGEQVNLPKSASEWIAPIAWRDVLEELNTEDPNALRLLGISAASMLGLGISQPQTTEYKQEQKDIKSAINEATTKGDIGTIIRFRLTGKIK